MCANDSQASGDDSPSDGRSSNGTYERRSLLKSALGFGAASALAGCGSDGGGGGTDAPTDGTTDPGTDPQSVASPTESPANDQSPTATRTDVESHQGPSDGAIIVPPDGDINAALQEVAGSGGWSQHKYGVVRLQAHETYKISETIEMPLGTVLDCNGARMEPTDNIDVIDASSSSYVKRPFIDARNTSGWNSNLIKVSTRVNKVSSTMPAIIEEMMILAPPKQGTGVKIIDSNGEGLWAAQMTGVIQKAETGIHLRAEGEESWVNSCFFDGLMRGHRTAILMDADPIRRPVNAHKMNVTFQPSDTEWFWDLQRGGVNKIRGTIWDSQHISDGTFWRIGENSQLNNVLIDDMGSYNWEDNVVDDKFGGRAPNGASGNTLFNWSTAHAQMSLKNTVDDLVSRVEELENN